MLGSRCPVRDDERTAAPLSSASSEPCTQCIGQRGYYAWMDRPLSKRARDELRLELEIKAADKRTRQTYGPERLQHDLAEHGVQIGVSVPSSLCQEILQGTIGCMKGLVSIIVIRHHSFEIKISQSKPHFEER